LIDKYANILRKEYQANWDEPLKLSVFDIACGKGGDLGKWKRAGVRNYYGLDIAIRALKDAMERKIQSFETFSGVFINEDASVDPEVLKKKIPEDIWFDMISC
jgi:SAM-dependent methyltransferase